MSRALTSLLLAGIPLCIAARVTKPCRCDECERQSSGMARGSLSAFNRFGVVVLHLCPKCAKDAPELLCLYGLKAAYLKSAKGNKLTPVAAPKPEPKAARQIDYQLQLEKLNELGHGFPWRERRFA